MAEPLAGGVSENSVPARERAAALIGRTISDRYKILELVAMGGMGAVYRAEHVLMRKEVAIKVLHPETEGFPELVARFEREAVAGAHVQHPNVAIASDFGKFDGESRFLVLEYIRGRTIRELIDDGPVAPARAARIVRQIAAALGAVHQKGIVHRDLKPRNVMVLPGPRHGEDQVKLIDFGLAKVPVEQLSAGAMDPDQEGKGLTAAGVVMGTVAYMAPEAALGMRSVGPRADLYALGVIFYEMLAGLHPFDAVEPALLFAQHRAKTPPPVHERNHTVAVPPAIEAVLMKLLAKDPEDRQRDADTLVAALDAALAPPAPVALGTPSMVPPADASTHSLISDAPLVPRSSRRWVGVGAAALLLGAGIVGVRLSGEPEAGPAAPASATPVAASAPAGLDRAPPPPPDESALPAAPPPPAGTSVRDRLRRVVDGKNGAAAAALLLELAAADTSVFHDRAVQVEAAAAAELSAADPAGNEVFDALAQKLGTDGLDILFDVLMRAGTASGEPPRPGAPTLPTDAASRARLALAQPAVLARATPALRIAFELHRASCTYRQNLFPRAAKEGDDRALSILASMTPPGCSPQTQLCCLVKNSELERAVADIQTRLRR